MKISVLFSLQWSINFPLKVEIGSKLDRCEQCFVLLNRAQSPIGTGIIKSDKDPFCCCHGFGALLVSKQTNRNYDYLHQKDSLCIRSPYLALSCTGLKQKCLMHALLYRECRFELFLNWSKKMGMPLIGHNSIRLVHAEFILRAF